VFFSQLTGDETMAELLVALSRCSEFSEVQLRMNERRPLNVLNRCRGREVVRFPLPGRIKSRDMKVNVLVQASLGALPMPDASLHQETLRVLRIAQRIAKCEYKWLIIMQNKFSCDFPCVGLSEFLAVKRPHTYRAALGAARLAKSLQCRMWHDSPFVSRQLPRIGPALANLLASAGKTTFAAIRDSNPRDLERVSTFLILSMVRSQAQII
jgi:ATP-dependent DNA helicase HFM1/MER3